MFMFTMGNGFDIINRFLHCG